ncbi:MAG: TolC family protein [Chitinophagaceae bacterium]
MKRILETCVLLSAYVAGAAQSSMPLTIEDCYATARQHYPLLKQTEVIAKSKEYSVENISKGWLPQVSFSGQVTYQSAVTEIPIKLPNIAIDNPSRDQYKIFAEVNQALFDGGISKQQKQLLETSEVIEQQKLEVEVYKLKDRINQLFFGILLINEQLDQVQTLKKDIQSGISKVEGALNNGAALKSSVDVLKAELLKTQQHETEMRAGRKAYLTMLGLYLNKTLDESSVLNKPRDLPQSSTINRPELHLYELQKKSLDVQDKLIKAKNQPRVGLFLQTGYGKPALNLLKNKFDAYYIGGLRVTWSLSGFYTEKKDQQLQVLNRQSIDIQKQTFLFNTGVTLSQQDGDVEKIRALIKTDNEIIALRTSIKSTANAQLNFGTITSNDYIREVTAEDMAKQNLLLHQVQLLMTQYSQRITTGK